ncbi:hypothetical protein HK104_004644, partial [Borealophlyctis nickersoniae]
MGLGPREPMPPEAEPGESQRDIKMEPVEGTRAPRLRALADRISNRPRRAEPPPTPIQLHEIVSRIITHIQHLEEQLEVLSANCEQNFYQLNSRLDLHRQDFTALEAATSAELQSQQHQLDSKSVTIQDLQKQINELRALKRPQPTLLRRSTSQPIQPEARTRQWIHSLPASASAGCASPALSSSDDERQSVLSRASTSTTANKNLVKSLREAIPTFTSKGGSPPLLDFLSIVDAYFEKEDYSASDQVAFVTTKFTDYSSNWWRSITHDHPIGDPQLPTKFYGPGGLKERLLDTFSNTQQEMDVLHKLSTLKMYLASAQCAAKRLAKDIFTKQQHHPRTGARRTNPTEAEESALASAEREGKGGQRKADQSKADNLSGVRPGGKGKWAEVICYVCGEKGHGPSAEYCAVTQQLAEAYKKQQQTAALAHTNQPPQPPRSPSPPFTSGYAMIAQAAEFEYKHSPEVLDPALAFAA